MNHFCIFQVTKNKKVSFCIDFEDDFDGADNYCQSLNNFRNSVSDVCFIVRCLDSHEFASVGSYNPYITSVVLS